MKNKNIRLLALFIVLVVVVVLVVLGSTVFTVKNISVAFYDENEIIELYGKEEEIVEGVKDDLLGKSVFFLSDGDVAAMLKNPYASLVRAEIIFPGSVVLHIAERQELFAVKYGEQYFMCDRYGTVLRAAANIVNNIEGYNILTELNEGDLTEAPVIGQKINLTADKLTALTDIAGYLIADKVVNGASENGYLVSQIRNGLVKSIKFEKSGEVDLVRIQTLRGTPEESHKIVINGLNGIGGEKGKFAMAWAVHTAYLTDNSTQDGTITVLDVFDPVNGIYETISDFK